MPSVVLGAGRDWASRASIFAFNSDCFFQASAILTRNRMFKYLVQNFATYACVGVPKLISSSFPSKPKSLLVRLVNSVFPKDESVTKRTSLQFGGNRRILR